MNLGVVHSLVHGSLTSVGPMSLHDVRSFVARQRHRIWMHILINHLGVEKPAIYYLPSSDFLGLSSTIV